jgi:hypothetical protein
VHTPTGFLEAAALLVALGVLVVLGRPLGVRLAACIGGAALLAFVIIGNVTLPLTLCAVGLLLARRTSRGADTPGARSFLTQVVVLFTGWAAYTSVRVFIEGDIDTATANALRIIDFERGLGLYFEPDLQALAMRSEMVVRFFNWVYSFVYLAFVAGALVWLWGTNGRAYDTLRNSLGVSVLPAVATIAFFAVAPPRLVPESGMVDTIALYGRERAFSNEFAAVPSLHVGWMAIAGIALAMATQSRWRYAIAVVPGAMMMLTVIITGNHYWIDGVVGTLYSCLYLMALERRTIAGASHTTVRAAGRATVAAASAGWSLACLIVTTPRIAFTAIGLGALWSYMLGMQISEPGFTDFWGYLFGQVTVILLALIALEVVFRKEGGLSPATHFVAVAACYADVIGTDGNLYARIDEYDKLTHFIGVAVVTAALYDILRCLNVRGTINWTPGERLSCAVLIGIAVGVGWEVYEFLGDRVFHTTRVQSRWDTGNDIVSDTLGALSVGFLLWFSEVSDWRGRTVLQAAGGHDSMLQSEDDA